MQKYGISLGGEQSGHIIIRPYLDTGDGILTAIKSLEASRLLGETFEEARDAIKVFPQTLLNVKVRDKKITDAPLVTETVDKIREKLSGRGRVLLRPSGTEPIIRIMVEVQSEDECREYAEQIEAAIRRAEEEIL
jgi:phosphoglucosamine mutase